MPMLAAPAAQVHSRLAQNARKESKRREIPRNRRETNSLFSQRASVTQNAVSCVTRMFTRRWFRAKDAAAAKLE